MRLSILRVGTVDSDIISAILQGLKETFPQAECSVQGDIMPIPQDAYDNLRRQYNSTKILAKMAAHTEKSDARVILGVTDVDLYASGLNFVFGEAQLTGKAALISLFRLRPEFYGAPVSRAALPNRAVKEAVHEIGHGLGLRHCKNPLCVMFFSNSITDTDKKRAQFCRECSLLISRV